MPCPTAPCANFGCTRASLAALNVVFIAASAGLIGLTAYMRAAAIVTSIGVVSGILACAVLLLLLSVLGLAGALRHSQALLFFYSLLLGLVCLAQLLASCTCLGLALAGSHQAAILEAAWRRSPDALRADIQSVLECCGFANASLGPSDSLGHPPCHSLVCCADAPDTACCTGSNSTTASSCPCHLTCLDATKGRFGMAARTAGGVGFAVALAEAGAVWLAIRYRNMRNPNTEASAYI